MFHEWIKTTETTHQEDAGEGDYPQNLMRGIRQKVNCV